jgi:uncharacterized protein
MTWLRVLCLVYGFVGIVAAALPLLRQSPAHAQGFDCRKAADVVDRAICNTPELATLDTRLAGIWQKFQIDHPDQIAAARKEGVVWWRARKHCAEQSDLIGCVRDAETARIAQLQTTGSPTLPVSPPTQATAPGDPVLEQFCTRQSNYTGDIVKYRDSGQSWDAAIRHILKTEWAYSDSTGGVRDSLNDTMVSTVIVLQAYQMPYPAVTEVAARIKATCMAGTAFPDPPAHGTRAAVPQANSQAISPAVGKAISLIPEITSSVDCSQDMCEFARGQTPQALCPGAGPCDRLTLFTDKAKVVVGYVAYFSREDWSRSLDATTKVLGPAKKETIGPSGIIKMRNDRWSFRTSDGGSLEYSAWSGVDMFGEPIDRHSIMLFSAEMRNSPEAK